MTTATMGAATAAPLSLEEANTRFPENAGYPPSDMCMCDRCKAIRVPFQGVFDWDAINDLCQELGITAPVDIRIGMPDPDEVNGEDHSDSAGTHRLLDGVHHICIHPTLDVATANQTLLHELRHAHQAADFYDDETGWLRYHNIMEMLFGYEGSPHEVDADRFADERQATTRLVIA